MKDRVRDVLGSTAARPGLGTSIGFSREGRSIRAFRFGHGVCRVSLLGGCHADEPVGPQLLSRLAHYLSVLPDNDPLLTEYEWWIVPHINPDGAVRNRQWSQSHEETYRLVPFLTHRARELPGDDIEFGFPHDSSDTDARPENQAVHDWWRSADGPFALHVSLHGMGFSAGPWFLLEAEWRNRCGELKERCARRVEELGYKLHDVQRNGEKGFFRLGRGFCTRPDSRYMREHFSGLGDEATAALFRPSSMEAMRTLGGDPLTLVSEMPLFITPGVGEDLGPPDPIAEQWKAKIDEWTAQLKASDRDNSQILNEAKEVGLRAMSIRDQMDLQWTFIVAGIEQVRIDREGGGADK